MIVTGSPAAITAQPQTATDGSKASLNYDSFLKLLIATMKNQDPTQPSDPAQTLSQLASFSSVEQGIKTNAKLDSLMSVAAGGQAGSLIGKLVTSADGHTGGIVKSIEINAGGLVAIIESGQRIAIGSGVTVAAP